MAALFPRSYAYYTNCARPCIFAPSLGRLIRARQGLPYRYWYGFTLRKYVHLVNLFDSYTNNTVLLLVCVRVKLLNLIEERLSALATEERGFMICEKVFE